jgi:1-aminocyclopropane-1-carboxylate deaminase/D-cysteine desulfhydrase-like pyridoxal-dependent ACC family enzyme
MKVSFTHVIFISSSGGTHAGLMSGEKPTIAFAYIVGIYDFICFF